MGIKFERINIVSVKKSQEIMYEILISSIHKMILTFNVYILVS